MEPLSWTNIVNVINIGERAVLPVCSGSVCLFVINETAGNLSLRLPNPERLSVKNSRFKELEIRERSVAGQPFWQLDVSESTFSYQLYLLSLSIVQAIEAGTPMPGAIAQSIELWNALTRERKNLSIQEQVGLMGELLFLYALAIDEPAKALSAWTGPKREPHDFRLERGEIEVKTTLASERVHQIHGLAQLTPSLTLPLFLVSLQLKPSGAGGGITLPELVNLIATKICPADELLFKERLFSLGYHPDDADAYEARYALRKAPASYLVDAEFPALTRNELISAIGDRSNLIRDISYEIFLPEPTGEAQHLFHHLKQLTAVFDT